MKTIILASSLLIIVMIILIIIILFLSFKSPYCGGYVDPTLGFCDTKGKRHVNRAAPSSCDPRDELSTYQIITKFVLYIQKLIVASKHSDLYRYTSTNYPQAKVYHGIFLFAVPELLKILPSDFGQNYTTPYGIVSFYQSFIPCIQDIDKTCQYIVGPPTSEQDRLNIALRLFCKDYFAQLVRTNPNATKECPSTTTDHNKGLYIQDIPFFNVIGMLGAFQVRATQAVVLYAEIPVKELELNYWSFNVYMADNYNPKEECYPFRQTYVASICPPFNLFTGVSESKKPFNPLTGEGTVKEGSVCMYIIISPSKTVAERVKDDLSQKANPVDCIHIFEVCAGSNSMIIEPELPNPNHLSSADPLVDLEYQRLCCFLRLSNRPTASTVAKKLVNQFIYRQGPYVNNFDVVMLDFENVQTNVFFQQLRLPPMIQPRVNEVTLYQTTFRKLVRTAKNALRRKWYGLTSLPTRNSTLNIFAPRFREILNTTLPYRGGYQAIQMAGNAQGDNYDAQYRLAKATCLTQDDNVLVAICFNHAHVDNCLYNSINIVDVNKAYGYDAVVLDKNTDVGYYIVLCARSNELLNKTQDILTRSLGTNDISYTKILVKTGPSLEGAVPLCHQVLLVERVYVNTSFPSKSSPDTIYRLSDLFGTDLQSFVPENMTQDVLDSLQNVVAPLNDQLIAPVFFSAKYSTTAIRNVLIVVCVVVFLCIVVLILVWYIVKRRALHKVDARKKTVK